MSTVAGYPATNLQAPQLLTDTYPVTLAIDGRDIRFQIKRLEFGEYNRFDREFIRQRRVQNKHEARVARQRQTITDPVTQQSRPETDDEVLARLDAEETDAACEARERAEARESDAAAEFLVTSLTRYVTCEPGQLSSASAPVVSGEDVLKYYGGRRDDVLGRLLWEIYLQNAFSDEKKKALQSLRDSLFSFSASNPTANGDAPAPTAAPASAKDSASPETATGSSETPSGSMARTS